MAHCWRACVSFLLMLWPTLSIPLAEGSIGINYGRVANNLPPPRTVLELVRSLNIDKVKIFDTDRAVIRAFANTGISLVVCVQNDAIISLAQSEPTARRWLRRNIVGHVRATRITTIAVGNEVLSGDASVWPALVPAMWNLHTALVHYGLDESIKISTPNSMGVLAVSYPPSAGVFNSAIASSIMHPMLDFLTETGSFFMLNVYPFFPYVADGGKNIPLNYALAEAGATGVNDSTTGLHYSNLFEAMVDAAISAMNSLNHSKVPIVVSETGWPTKGDPTELGAGISNAATYVSNIVKHSDPSHPVGTPMRPWVSFDTYIFALFNENLKPGPTSERNWGLFYPNGSRVYDIPV